MFPVYFASESVAGGAPLLGRCCGKLKAPPRPRGQGRGSVSCACTMPGSRLLPSPGLQRAVGRQFWLELRSQ